MTLQDAATLATQKADAFIGGLHAIRGLTVADLPPSNLADIVRHARFNPPTIRPTAAPRRIPHDFDVPLARELRKALFNRIRLRPIAPPGRI